MTRTPYPSDLNDTEWQLLAPLLPPPKPGGRPIKYPRREIVNAILYILRTGAAWQQVNDALCQQTRQRQGRHPEPSAAIIDSQSVKTTEKRGRAATTWARK